LTAVGDNSQYYIVEQQHQYMAGNSYTQNIPDSNHNSKMINSSGVNYNVNDTIIMEPSSTAFKPLQQQLQQSDVSIIFRYF